MTSQGGERSPSTPGRGEIQGVLDLAVDAVRRNGGAERAPADFYPSPRWTVERLLEVSCPPWGTWIEPCAGDGAIIRAADRWLKENGRARPTWRAVELRPECRGALEATGAEVAIADVLESAPRVLTASGSPEPVVAILTNPPFSHAEDIIRACLPRAPWCAFLLRLGFLESIHRREWLASDAPDVFVLPNRPSFGLDKHGKLGTDGAAYGWFVWGAERGRSEGRVRVLAVTPREQLLEAKREQARLLRQGELILGGAP